LVVATLHATNSAHALNRVISFYPTEARFALFQDMATRATRGRFATAGPIAPGPPGSGH